MDDARAAESNAVAAILRTAARLLGGAAALLHRAGDEPGLADDAELVEGSSRASVRAWCARVFECREPLLIPSLREVEESTDQGPGALAAVPVTDSAGRVRGALVVVAEEPREWPAESVQSLVDLATAVGAELDRQDAEEELADLSRALARSESRYRRLLSACPSAMFIVSPDGYVQELNPAAAEIMGRPLAELVGAHMSTMVAPEDLDFAFAELAEATSGRKPRIELELRIVRPSGERRLVLVNSMAMEQDGEVVGVQGVARDITDERTREMQLRRAERMASVGPLLSGVCHELNNPLTSIKSFAELLLLDERPEEDREALEIVQREAHRAAKIVSDLRVVARQTQEAGSGRGVVQLNELVRHALELRGASLVRHGVEVALDLAEDLPPVWAVRAHLEQVVAQLIGNAEHALREHPGARQVSLRTYRGDLGIALLVGDTGPGIAAEHLDRIFDPFWTTKRAGEGTGLGLSLVNGIITDHGGRIRVDSQPGRGATFTIDLPLGEMPPVTLGSCEDVSASHGLRILVVDDEAPIRFSLRRYMERRGHQVEEAPEGREALRLLESAAVGAPFDIIVADLRMPGLNGEQLLNRLRERRDGTEHRLIFITGDAEAPDFERVVREAGVPVVWKPFELAEVAQIIEAQAGMASA